MEREEGERIRRREIEGKEGRQGDGVGREDEKEREREGTEDKERDRERKEGRQGERVRREDERERGGGGGGR